MKYSATTGLFYNPAWDYANLPDDLVDVCNDEFNALQESRSIGCIIVSDSNGRPISVPPPPYVQTREDVEIARLLAYADPVTGSDRYRAEAEAERLQGNEDAAKEAEQKMLSRRAEIQAANPWPTEG